MEYPDAYRAASHDLNGIQVFITTRRNARLKRFLKEAARECDSDIDNPVWAPCIVGRRTHMELQYYSASLLIPPDISDGSDLCTPGLVVPQLKVNGYTGERANPTGFLFISDHTGRQEYYAHRFGELARLGAKAGVEFHGVIREVGKGKRPLIEVLRSSETAPEVFEQNKDMLQRLRNDARSGLKFWWNMELPPEGHHVGQI